MASSLGSPVGPEIVLPSELLPLIWGGQAPDFADEDDAKAILGTIMARYNEILRQWDRLFKSKRGGQILFLILILCGDENGESLLGLTPEDEDRVMEEAAQFTPVCVTAIVAYWREKGSKQISMPLMRTPLS